MLAVVDRRSHQTASAAMCRAEHTDRGQCDDDHQRAEQKLHLGRTSLHERLQHRGASAAAA
jgi:hypothetical protein